MSAERRPFKVAMASLIGTAVEWYDFYAYSTAAALVFDELFFPTFDPLTGTFLAFATYAVGFLARPLGGVVFGHLGDRIGRKRSLVLSLLIMGVATVLVGALPTYAAIGVAAPLALTALRFVQGVAVGGEWGGAVLLAAEHAPPHRRTFFAAFPQVGSPVGLLLATIVISLFNLLPNEAFLAWGWRVPFLFSATLVILGLVIRLKVEESPEFVAAQAEVEKQNAQESLPILEVFRSHWRTIFIGLCAVILTIGGFYIVNTFMLAYCTTQLGMSRQSVLNGQIVVAIVEGALLLFFAHLGDRIGKRPIAVYGALFTAAWAFPMFWLANTADPILLAVGMGVGIVGITAVYAVIASLVTELYPVRLRYTGISLSYQLAGAVGGGAPLLATYFVKETGGSAWPTAVLHIALSLTTAVGVVYAARIAQRRAAGQALTPSPTPTGNRQEA